MIGARNPGLAILDGDGSVIAQNDSARWLLGDVVGRPCWDAVGGLERAEGQCCRTGCVVSMLAEGLDAARHTQFALGDHLFDLRCIPGGDIAFVVLTPAERRLSRQWERVTPRELEILGFIANGDTTASIAARLGISRSTVRTHVEHLRTKLGVPTRAAVVAMGFRLGLLS